MYIREFITSKLICTESKPHESDSNSSINPKNYETKAAPLTQHSSLKFQQQGKNKQSVYSS